MAGGRGRGGPGFGGGPRVNGVELDPLLATNDMTKPLISKLLAVPSLRTRYLAYVKDIAQKWLDWNKVGPIAQKYHSLIAADVRADTRKLYSWDAFQTGLSGDTAEAGGRGPNQETSLKSFTEKRQAYLLNRPDIKKAEIRADTNR